MKITQLQAENVKRIRAVEITPSGSVVIIGGRNGQGKSSVLDSIMYALAGAGAIPPVPLRNGEKKGHVTVTLDDLVITRKFRRTDDGDITTSLEVRRPNGDRVVSPQALLDSLCGKIAFDPLEFARMKPKQQLEMLKQLLNIDFTGLDQQRDAVFGQRTEVNRQLKAKRAELDAIPRHTDVPEVEISLDDLHQELRGATAHNEQLAANRRALADHERQNALLHQQATRAAEHVVQLQKQMEDLARALETAQATAASWTTRAAVDDDVLAGERKLMADSTGIDPDPIYQKLTAAQEINRRVQQNHARKKVAAAVRDLQQQAERLTATIESCDQYKAEVIRDAKLPVPGLGFTEEGVTLDGLPLEQASTRDRIRLSVAMGLALNPKLPVMFIREGSLLYDDADGLQLIAAMAEEAKAQVWIERVSTGAECSVVIEDGMIAEPQTQACAS